MLAKLTSLLLAATVFSASAQAATLIDTGAPSGNSQVLVSSGGTTATYGALFTLAGDTVLNSVTAYFSSNANGATATATIARSTNGLPGVSLFNTSFDLSMTNGSTPFTGTFGANVLTAGSYFVLFAGTAVTNASLSLGIGASNPSPTEVFIDERYTAYQSTNAGFAFNIQGTPVAVATVPEPATWAMMVGGFALVGGAMRVRRRRVMIIA